MQNCHSVIHLGGLVGDPACAIDENLTTEVNLTSTKILGTIAKAAGAKTIFAVLALFRRSRRNTR